MADETRIPILDSLRSSLELCAFCPKMCRFACPVAEADSREALNPWAKMSAAYLATKGGAPLSLAFETSWACTACGHCTEYCAHGNAPGIALAAVRAAGIEAGLPSPVTKQVVEHAHGKSKHARATKIPFDLRDDGSSPALFMAGCSDSHGAPKQGALLHSAVALLEKTSLKGVSISAGECCGSSLWAAGRPDLFDEHAHHFAAAVARRRVLIVADASCAWTLRSLYASRGIRLEPEVLHVTEWLASLFRERVLVARRRVKGPHVWHDPCHLARDLGVLDEPRAVLAAVLAEPLREFTWNRRDTNCCGGGALLPRSMPETAKNMAARRAQAAPDDATIVTSCPTCQTSLGGHGREIADLLSLVVESL